LAIALYTFDLGADGAASDGRGNFYFAANEIFRSRPHAGLVALKPFIYHLKRAWDALPVLRGLFYRGVPRSAVATITALYTAGRTVHWNSVTSLSSRRDVAEDFADKEGIGGLVMEVSVVDGRSIASYSILNDEDEVILEPSVKLTVTQPVSALAQNAHRVLKLQQISFESTVYW
jgi:hypothetical protein